MRRHSAVSSPGHLPRAGLSWLAASAAALALAFVAVMTPVAGVLVAGGALVCLAALGAADRAHKVFLSAVAVLLLGYAFLGRGFAYIGYPPVYVGELVLALGIILAIVGGGLTAVLRSPLSRILLLFAAWGAFRTFPYVGVYGMDALRDGVIWGYAAFALLMGAAFLRASAFDGLGRVLRVAYPPFLFWLPIAVLLRTTQAAWIPMVPGTVVPIVDLKGGDAGVHLAGAAAFLAFGFFGSRGTDRRPRMGPGNWVWWSAWAVGFLLLAAQGRAGLLAASSGLLLVIVVRPFGSWWKLAPAAALLVALFVSIGLQIDLGRTRKVSPEQMLANAKSIFGMYAGDDLEGTARWRLQWWGDIVQYTVRGEHFWLGKGFGVNLARDDGYAVASVRSEPELRSPHNGHMTVLARGGVPGAALWLCLQAGFGLALWAAYRRAVRRGDERWAAVDLWVLAYWCAFMINGAFDVYLEGPQGGIWFWSVFGIGIAALELQRRDATVPVPGTHGLRPW